jgi:hypothetical protein
VYAISKSEVLEYKELVHGFMSCQTKERHTACNKVTRRHQEPIFKEAHTL